MKNSRSDRKSRFRAYGFWSYALIGFSILLGACDRVHLSNDPFKDYGDDVRNAHRIGEKPKKPTHPGLSKNTLFVMKDKVLSFKEGESSSFTISGRATPPDKNWKIEGLELQLEPNEYGIQLKEPQKQTRAPRKNVIDRVLEWTPEIGMTGSNISTTITLQGSFRAKTSIAGNPEVKPAVERFTLVLIVNKTRRTPQVDIVNLPKEMQEGTEAEFLLRIVDLDSGGDLPDIVFGGKNDEFDVSPLVRRKDPTAIITPTNGVFEVPYILDLKGRDLTPDVQAYSVRAEVTSKFGVSSPSAQQEVVIFSKVEPPFFDITRGSRRTLRIGAYNVVSFKVATRSEGEGWVKVDFQPEAKQWCTNVGLTCSCSNEEGRYYQECILEGLIPADKVEEEKTLSLSATVIGEVPPGRDPKDNQIEVFYDFIATLKPAQVPEVPQTEGSLQ